MESKLWLSGSREQNLSLRISHYFPFAKCWLQSPESHDWIPFLQWSRHAMHMWPVFTLAISDIPCEAFMHDHFLLAYKQSESGDVVLLWSMINTTSDIWYGYLYLYKIWIHLYRFQSLQGGSCVAVTSKTALTLRSATLGQTVKGPLSRTSLQLRCKGNEAWSTILCTLIPGKVWIQMYPILAHAIIRWSERPWRFDSKKRRSMS